MNITQDDGDNEHSFSPERIVSRLHIAATLTNLIAVWKRGITKREYDWVNPLFQFLQSKKKENLAYHTLFFTFFGLRSFFQFSNKKDTQTESTFSNNYVFYLYKKNLSIREVIMLRHFSVQIYKCSFSCFMILTLCTVYRWHCLITTLICRL